MHLPYEITTTLLLPRPAQIDVDQLRIALGRRLGAQFPQFEETTHRLEPLLTASNLHLFLQARDLPVPEGRLTEALSSRLPDILLDDPATPAASHRAAVTVTAGFGPEPRAKGDAPVKSLPQQAFDQLLILGHVAATHLARQVHPLAIHWGQSEQILSPARFDAMADILFPLPLFLHPHPTREEHDGIDWLALEVRGASHLIGAPLRTAPAPVSFHWMMARVYAFVSHLRATGQKAAAGMAFATAEGERFTLQQDADGSVSMVLEVLDGEVCLNIETPSEARQVRCKLFDASKSSDPVDEPVANRASAVKPPSRLLGRQKAQVMRRVQ